MLILYLQKALCLKLSLDIFATNIEKVPKELYILSCFYQEFIILQKDNSVVTLSFSSLFFPYYLPVFYL